MKIDSAKATMKDVVEVRDFAKEEIQFYKGRINKLKETHAPRVIIENEERKLKDMLIQYNVAVMAIRFYKMGFRDAGSHNYKNLRLLRRELSPEERLLAALFGE